MNGQSKKLSLIEAIANHLIGYVIGIWAAFIIFPIFDLHMDLSTNMKIGLIFTIINFIRSYIIRRIFNRFFDYKRKI